MLTKSLHTITATLNVARYLLGIRKETKWNATYLAGCALSVLGYEYTRAELDRDADPTIAKIVAGCAKLLKDQS